MEGLMIYKINDFDLITLQESTKTRLELGLRLI